MIWDKYNDAVSKYGKNSAGSYAIRALSVLKDHKMSPNQGIAQQKLAEFCVLLASDHTHNKWIAQNAEDILRKLNGAPSDQSSMKELLNAVKQNEKCKVIFKRTFPFNQRVMRKYLDNEDIAKQAPY